MIELEKVLIPNLKKYVSPWTRYFDQPPCFDDTITSIKPGCILKVTTILSNFHEYVKFTQQLEDNGQISF